ncbi:MAG: c-type cytochrome [Gammaproteobacteria bacterium]|nr:c-type cytochrome [Gammaproteobacteria bacterium]MBU1655225.1 c-type cytochrome [Gammaproteobacteria bacterium]MBU1960671.1 c-type cytochrome [Gammaproteobacteria bacterium]
MLGLSLCAAVPVLAGTPIQGEPILPLSSPQQQDEPKVALGRLLFHDTRLSQDNSISCASCHPLTKGGMDGKARSPGVMGAMGVINAPTVYNSGLSLAQFWDGRAPDLEAQVEGPIHNPIEMASNWDEVIPRLRRDRGYPRLFRELYGTDATETAVCDAIAHFERSLVTIDSPFDRWLRGDETALSDKAREGYALFKSYGCVACHQGAGVGGNMFQRMGAMGDWFADRKTPLTPADLGRFNTTGREEDRYSFKVPSLRLAALTAPYFHDGSVDSLAEAVRVMARYQLGRRIPDAHVEKIVAFLESLVGRHKELAP